MTVNELIEMLKDYPPDMEILNERYSDHAIIKLDEWHVIKGVQQGFYVMRSHPTMSAENKVREKEYLVLEGN